MTDQPDHEFEILEDDETVPPRPEELIADAAESGPRNDLDPPIAEHPDPSGG